VTHHITPNFIYERGEGKNLELELHAIMLVDASSNMHFFHFKDLIQYTIGSQLKASTPLEAIYFHL
jgi:hypothetical protein